MGFLEEVRDERKRNIDRGDDEVGGKVGQGPFFFFKLLIIIITLKLMENKCTKGIIVISDPTMTKTATQ